MASGKKENGPFSFVGGRKTAFLCANSAIDADRVEAVELRDLYEERAAIRQFDGGYTKDQAERLAWAEVAALWYRLHGERVPAALCAGCGEPISGHAVHLLPHGERAHADGNHACIIAYGRRWRSAAALALSAIGISTPAGALLEEEPGNAA